MSADDARKLLGGYATGTLTEAERAALFEASLHDAALFEALADEEALKEMLDDSSCRGELLRGLDGEEHFRAAAASVSLTEHSVALPKPAAPQPPRKRSIWSRWLQPVPIAIAVSLGLSVVVVSSIRQGKSSRSVRIVAQKPQSPRPPETMVKNSQRAAEPSAAAQLTPLRKAPVDRSQRPLAAPPQAAPLKDNRGESDSAQLKSADQAKEPAKAVETERRDGFAQQRQAESGTQQVQNQASRPAVGAAAELAQTPPPPAAAASPREMRVQRDEKAAVAPIAYFVFRREAAGDWTAVSPDTNFKPGDRAKVEVRVAEPGVLTLTDVNERKVLFTQSARAGELLEVPLQVAFDKGPRVIRLNFQRVSDAATMSYLRGETMARAKTASAPPAPLRKQPDITVDIQLNTTSAKQ